MPSERDTGAPQGLEAGLSKEPNSIPNKERDPFVQAIRIKFLFFFLGTPRRHNPESFLLTVVN